MYVRAEYPLALRRIKIGLKVAEERGLIGDNIMGSDFSFHIKLKEGAGAFVCGEETALMQSIEGNRGMPRLRPPFPAESGLWKRPTNINNVETLAVVPWIIENGAEAFASRGYEKSKGTKVFALAGKVNRTGLAEVPMGMTPARRDLHASAAASRTTRRSRPCRWAVRRAVACPSRCSTCRSTTRPSTRPGAIVGSGGMIVIDEDNCIVDTARYFLSFTQQESCGKCPPCRIGTKRMLDLLTKICDGKGTLGRPRVPRDDGRAGQGRFAVRAGRHRAQPGVHGSQVLPRGVRGARRRQEVPRGHLHGARDVLDRCRRPAPAAAPACACARPAPSPARGKKSTFLTPSICIKCGACYEKCRFDAVRRS